jgi:hypothetical protein
VDGKESRESCHRHQLAFPDGPAHAEDTTGQIHPRSGISLVTVAHCSVVDTGEGDARIARKQALVPMLSETPSNSSSKGNEQGPGTS